MLPPALPVLMTLTVGTGQHVVALESASIFFRSLLEVLALEPPNVNQVWSVEPLEHVLPMLLMHQ
jgi:hypothetical protein